LPTQQTVYGIFDESSWLKMVACGNYY